MTTRTHESAPEDRLALEIEDALNRGDATEIKRLCKAYLESQGHLPKWIRDSLFDELARMSQEA